MKILTHTLFFLLISISGSFSKDFNILQLGAVPDGRTPATTLIQEAIDECSESGGGTVTVPPGKFLTGSLILKNGVTFEVQKGATLYGSKNLSDYLNIQPRYIALRTGKPTRQLIFAEDQHNIAIIGEGTINGQGEVFEKTATGDDPGVTRPHLIQLINCKNVRIEGITMLNSGGWMQHYLACENLRVTGINVYNHCNYNNDGIDIDGCHDAVISGCIVDSDDDGICLKSTSPKSCVNVLVTGCVVKSHCNALKIGTESTGGFQNIIIKDCTVSPSADDSPIYGTRNGQSAVSVEMVDGGLLEQVSISNIVVTETDCPIFLRLGNRARKYAQGVPEPEIGILRNVIFSDIVAATSSGITSNITGIPGSYAENISLSNIIITNHFNGKEEIRAEVPENERGYPTAGMFGKVLPASGFYIRHVRNITFNNVQLINKGDDTRPAFIFNDVKDALVNYPVVYSYGSDAGVLVKDADCENIKVLN